MISEVYNKIEINNVGLKDIVPQYLNTFITHQNVEEKMKYIYRVNVEVIQSAGEGDPD